MSFEIENGVLKKYTGNETKVVIPNFVTGIGERAFACCESLEKMSFGIESEETSFF